MTAQATELLILDGEELHMCDCPFDDYLESSSKKWNFAFRSTACWRGYYGAWEVIGDRLYLKSLDGELESGEPVSLETIFPGYPEGVFAHWFSGTVRCPQGKLLKYEHMGFGSKYERDLFLEFKGGVLIGKTLVANGKAADDSPDGYTLGGFTVFPREGGANE